MVDHLFSLAHSQTDLSEGVEQRRVQVDVVRDLKIARKGSVVATKGSGTHKAEAVPFGL